MSRMLLSLIICTYKRNRELRDVIRSLSPLPAEIEIVIVDQNSKDERFEARSLLETGINSEQLIIVKKKLGSLSCARNEGFKRCTGEFVGIPDDDNYYDDSFREEIVGMLDSVRLKEDCGGVILNWGAFSGFPPSQRKMKSLECLRYGNSGTIVVRKDVVSRHLGMKPFPEDMSPGTRFPAGDETYFLASFLKSSRLKMIAAPNIYIDHPIFPETDDREKIYGYGFGALAFKLMVMRWGPGAFLAFKLLVGPLIRIISYNINGEARKRSWLMLRRRWKGAIDYAKSGDKSK